MTAKMEDSFKTVKMTVNQFCSDPYLIERIDEMVLNANHIMFEVYAFANLHIIRLLERDKSIPKLDQSFFYDCCVFVSETYERKAQKPKRPDMLAAFEVYRTQRPKGYEPPFRDYTCNVINYICKDMVIATTNHLVLNFYKRFTNYLKRHYDLDKKQAYSVAKGVYEESYEGDDEFVLYYRSELGDRPPYDKYVKKDPTYILRVYKEMRDDCKRAFSLLPHKNSFTMSYITIDRSVMIDILNLFKKREDKTETIKKMNEISSEELKTSFREDPLEYWNMFFQVDKVKNFAEILKTDGKAVSVMCDTVRPLIEKKTTKKTKVKFKRDDTEYDVIRAIDPGFRYMFVASTVGTKDTIKCSSKEYYHMCGMTSAAKQKQRYYDNDETFGEKFKAIPSNKTNDEKEYLSFLKYALRHVVEFLEFHHGKQFRNMRFTTHVRRQKTIHELCRKVTGMNHPGDKTVKCIIGFGDWSTQRDSIIRGHRRGPVQAFKTLLRRWCDVVDVDEFRTSKLCCNCHHVTEKVRFDDVEVNSVLRCTNNECGTTVDRDINGAKNILALFVDMLQGKERPEAFSKKLVVEKGDKTVESVITPLKK